MEQMFCSTWAFIIPFKLSFPFDFELTISTRVAGSQKPGSPRLPGVILSSMPSAPWRQSTLALTATAASMMIFMGCPSVMSSPQDWAIKSLKFQWPNLEINYVLWSQVGYGWLCHWSKLQKLWSCLGLSTWSLNYIWKLPTLESAQDLTNFDVFAGKRAIETQFRGSPSIIIPPGLTIWPSSAAARFKWIRYVKAPAFELWLYWEETQWIPKHPFDTVQYWIYFG